LIVWNKTGRFTRFC